MYFNRPPTVVRLFVVEYDSYLGESISFFGGLVCVVIWEDTGEESLYANAKY